MQIAGMSGGLFVFKVIPLGANRLSNMVMILPCDKIDICHYLFAEMIS